MRFDTSVYNLRIRVDTGASLFFDLILCLCFPNF